MRIFGTMYVLKRLFVVIGAIALAACGSSNSSNDQAGANNDSPGKGSVALLLTDAPADPDTFVAVNVTIEKVELMGDEERHVLFSGPSETINLFDLKNESMPFSFDSEVPVGEYCKIRLTLEELELVFVDDTPETLEDNDTYYPKLPGNRKLDLVIRDCVSVEDGQTLVMQLDMDAGRSIHITGNGNKYQFRPVVFVDVIAEDVAPKLLRINGELVKYDEDEGTLLICDALPTAPVDSESCVLVRLGDVSAYFDNVEYAGMPRALEELFDEDKLEMNLEVVGWPHYDMNFIADIELPDVELPPVGECLLWDMTLELDQLLASLPCEDLPEIESPEIVYIDEDGEIFDAYRPLLVIDALVVESGEFDMVTGVAKNDADATGVALMLASSETDAAEELWTEFQAGEEGINGTRFVSKYGQLLDESAVLAGIGLQIDGVLEELSETEMLLKAALVIVDTDSIDTVLLSGEVTEVDAETALIALNEPLVCGIAQTQLALDLTADFDLMTVIITDDESQLIPGGNFEAGQTVGISSSCDGTNFIPQSVVIVDDQRDEEEPVE